ncbi:endonuclease/exonuclease/phosphatase family protein [Psychromicrobium lacuslunae]|uniref:Endonuclease/exonuclease/phosphatase domain-containing protein n=1 Tax=Psychromicrobium lacuslunae TaxID=1618207 RepID=A0A0D4BXV0_9MICC|nr:endonuclease/exonuclease/phosphatase family protein [Psychromicrobium lacuslunae]AJT41143.1 hypothetical protein UM93_05715 [Psychromicrobium lacuslunae]
MPARHRPRLWLVLPAAFLALLVAIPSGLRILPWQLPELAISLLALLPWFVIPAAAALILALCGRAKWLSALCAILLLGQLFWLFPLDANRAEPCAAGSRIEIGSMSLNTRYGQADADRIVQLVRENRIGLLALQEFGGDLEKRLAAAGIDQLLPHKITSQVRGPGGSALYSKFPLEQLAPVANTPHEMVQARLRINEVSGLALEVTNVHTMIPGSATTAQWRSDLKTLGQLPSGENQRILLGDFNASLDHQEFRELLTKASLSDVASVNWKRIIPTFTPLAGLIPIVTLDHLAISPGLTASDYTMQAVGGSDHSAVSARLSIPEKCG